MPKTTSWPRPARLLFATSLALSAQMLPAQALPAPSPEAASATPAPKATSTAPASTAGTADRDEKEVVKLDTYVVSAGEWGALQDVIAARQDSGRLIDTVASNDLGVLPDFNIGENLQRLPGISVDLDQAEARYVTIRGFGPDYSSITVNGSLIAATERNSRRVQMDVLPASLASSIDVSKTQTPEMEGHSVGGAINVHGPRAIRKRPLTVKVNSKIGYYTADEGFRGSGPSGSADVLVTRTFAGGKMGLAVSANYYLRDSYTGQSEWGSTRYWYDNNGTRVTTPYGGNGYAVPSERRWFWYHNHRERKGGSIKWEFKPSSALSFWALAFYNTATDDEARQTDLITWNTSTKITNQTETSGTLTNPSMLQQQYLGKFDFTRTIGAIQAGADLNAGDNQLSGRVNYSGSFFTNPEDWNEWRQSGSQLAVNYRNDGDVIRVEDVNPSARWNLPAYAPNRRQFDRRNLREDVYEVAVDYSRFNLLSIPGLSAKAGAKFRRTDRVFDEQQDRYLPNTGNTYTLAAAGVVRSDIILRPPGAADGQSIMVIDPTLSRESFDAHLAANPGQWRYDPMIDADNSVDYRTVEDVSAGYLQGEYRRDRLSVIGGMRFEDTSYDSTGRVKRSGSWSDNTTQGGYHSWIPSAVATYKLTQHDRVVAAVSRTIGRPDFNKFAPVGESISESGGALTITRSNPNLKPRVSTNFNLSFDHLFANKAGYVGVSAFAAEVKSEIFNGRSEIDVMLDGVVREATVTQPTNIDRPYHVRGLEFAVVRDLDFLPSLFDGFKVNANLTLIRSNFVVPMSDGSYFETGAPFSAPKRAWNVAVHYEKKKFSAKLAWNHTGLKLTSRVNTSASYRNRYDAPVTRVTASVAYQLNRSWRINANVWNLTGVGRTELIGNNQELPMVEADFGAAYFVGFVYSFR